LLSSIGGSLAIAWVPGKTTAVPAEGMLAMEAVATEGDEIVVTLPEPARVIDLAPEPQVAVDLTDAPESIDVAAEPDMEVSETREPVIDLTSAISDEAEPSTVIDITPESESVSTDPNQTDRD